jgi:hypothetical protein
MLRRRRIRPLSLFRPGPARLAPRGAAAHGGDAEDSAMTPSKIQALGITQQWSTTSWKASGYVEGIGCRLAGGLGHEPDRRYGSLTGTRGPAYGSTRAGWNVPEP